MRGIQGYYDACLSGKLESGAHDFIWIHHFFRSTGLTLSHMVPDDGAAGGQPLLYKVIRDEDYGTYIIYLSNPDLYLDHAPDGFEGYYTDEFANESDQVPRVVLNLPVRKYHARWFDPSTGLWVEGSELDGGQCTVTAPGAGDWVLLLRA